MNMHGRRRRVTYRPSKASALMGGIMGGVFVFLGIFVLIPRGGLFGILWTLFAVGSMCYNLYLAFGGKYIGPEISIDESDGEAPAAPEESPDTRLQKLQTLYDRRLITPEEYEEKRSEILKEL